jgi:GNAT superfamily N-acetyltransferase
MTQSEYEAWRARSVAAYAAEHVAAGNWTAEEAPDRAAAEFETYLPQGRATAGSWLWTVFDEAGAAVGILWVAARRPGEAFIYDIEMAESRRGEGFGTAALNWLDDWARAQGFSSIGLHVFGHNTGAWQLYKRLGYIETDIQMSKTL